MRFRFRRRRKQVRSAPTPTAATAIHPNTTSNTTSANRRLSITPPSPAPTTEEPSPMPQLSPRERKLYRVATKREQRTAGQLAVRAGLQSSDGSGRGVVRDLNALVKAGKLHRHGAKTPYSYTRAA